ncbi:MAG: hypothetical protein R3275_13210 [Saprospiraceae bacterium]|nr:hypothetical protein [Saprospiraceae bacterium]
MVPIKRIKDHFYYRELERHTKTPAHSTPDNFLESIVFLMPSNGLRSLEDIHKILRRWHQPERSPVFIIFGLEAEDEARASSDMIFLGKKDVDWKGAVNKTRMQPVLDRHFDLLINMDRKGHRAMEHLSAAIQSSLKIGLLETRHRIYDILVETTSDDMLDNLKAIDEVLMKLRS